MFGFVKDLVAFATLGGFTVTALAWADIATRLV